MSETEIKSIQEIIDKIKDFLRGKNTYNYILTIELEMYLELTLQKYNILQYIEFNRRFKEALNWFKKNNILVWNKKRRSWILFHSIKKMDKESLPEDREKLKREMEIKIERRRIKQIAKRSKKTRADRLIKST